MKNELLNDSVLKLEMGDAFQTAAYLMPAIRGVCKPAPFPVVQFLSCPRMTEADFKQASDRISVWLPRAGTLEELYQQMGQIPAGTTLVGVEEMGLFACAASMELARARLEAFAQGKKTPEGEDFIPKGRMRGRVIIVTGGAQGLGRGVADLLLREGARVVLADMKLPLAQQGAEEFCRIYGADAAVAMFVDVSDDESVARLCRDTVLYFGGIDVMYSNAGIVISGDLEQMTSDKMTKVADVNYIGYFRCSKYASRYMKIQSIFDENYTADILNTSSVAGLVAYPKNFAYCGSKFAVIGLTQCFAKELLPYRIKVNSVCPGNFYDGPLWNDPEKGLFLQYLQAGKIPGGKTVQDSKEYYMGREPFQRGCVPEDVARGVLYCIEQQFETGIALPVTGGLAIGAIK